MGIANAAPVLDALCVMSCTSGTAATVPPYDAINEVRLLKSVQRERRPYPTLPLVRATPRAVRANSRVGSVPVLQIRRRPFPVAAPILITTRHGKRVSANGNSTTVVEAGCNPVKTANVHATNGVRILQVLQISNGTLRPLRVAFVRACPIRRKHPLIKDDIPPMNSSRVNTTVASAEDF